MSLLPRLLLLAGGVLLSARLYRRRRPRQPVPRDLELRRDLPYGTGGGRPLRLDLLRPRSLPEAPLPVLVFIHGGGWCGGCKENHISRLVPYARRGYACASIEYRLSGEAIFPAQIEDCKCAIRFLRAHAPAFHLDPERIGVWGISAGGHLAALLGTSASATDLEGSGGWPEFSSRVQAVCDWFGPTDLLIMAEGLEQSGISHRVGEKGPNAPDSFESRLVGGPVQERRDECRRADPITYVSANAPPFLILHGDRDPVVPLNQSQALAAALKEAGAEVEFHIIEGAGHSFDGSGVESLVEGFFDQCLGASSASL